MPWVRGGAVWAGGEGGQEGRNGHGTGRGDIAQGSPPLGGRGGRSLPAQVRGARGHARVERRQEEGEGGRGHPESEEGGGGGRAGARPRKGLRPVPSLCPPSLACSLVPLPGLSFLPLQAPAVRSAGGWGGAGESGVTVYPRLSWGAGPPVGRRPSLSGSAHPGTCA